MRTGTIFVLPGLAMAVALLAVIALTAGGQGAAQDRPHRVYVPAVASDGPLPTPTPAPTPVPDHGRVVGMRIESIGLRGSEPVEQRDTEMVGGREQFANPVNPQAIAHYPRFGVPARGGGNSIFAAHVNYYTGVRTPFRDLQKLKPGADIFLLMEDGTELRYTVKTNDTVSLASLDTAAMNQVVWPPLAADRERITLISCGGDFIRNRSGVGGSFTSRVIVTAERILH